MKARVALVVLVANLVVACAGGEGPAASPAMVVNGTEITQDELFDFLALLVDNPEVAAILQLDVSPGVGPSTYDSFGVASAMTWLAVGVVLDDELETADAERGELSEEEARRQVYGALAAALQVDAVSGQRAFEELSVDAQRSVLDWVSGLTALSTALGGEIEVSDAEVREYYDENESVFVERCVRHLMLDDSDPTGLFEKADQLRDELEEGADFEELVEESSVDPSASDNDGDLGCSPDYSSEFGPDFAAAVLDAELGTIQGPVSSPFGIHLLEVYDEQEVPFEEVEADIEGFLVEQRAAAQTELAAEAIQRGLVAAEVEIDPRFGTWELTGFDAVGSAAPVVDPAEAVTARVFPPEGPTAPSTTAAEAPLGLPVG